MQKKGIFESTFSSEINKIIKIVELEAKKYNTYARLSDINDDFFEEHNFITFSWGKYGYGIDKKYYSDDYTEIQKLAKELNSKYGKILDSQVNPLADKKYIELKVFIKNFK